MPLHVDLTALLAAGGVLLLAVGYVQFSSLREEVAGLRRDNQKLREIQLETNKKLAASELKIAVLQERTADLGDLKKTLQDLRVKEGKMAVAVQNLDQVDEKVRETAKGVDDRLNDIEQRVNTLENRESRESEPRIVVHNTQHSNSMLDFLSGLLDLVLWPFRGWLLPARKQIT